MKDLPFLLASSVCLVCCLVYWNVLNSPIFLYDGDDTPRVDMDRIESVIKKNRQDMKQIKYALEVIINPRLRHVETQL